jgi:hypothetical protein
MSKPLTEKERAEKYRREKSKTHKRISPWFSREDIDVIDGDRGDLTRAEWVSGVARKKIKRLLNLKKKEGK